jgi:hypothetical protein
MATTKRINTQITNKQKDLVSLQIEQLIEQLKQKLGQYEKTHNKEYDISKKLKISIDIPKEETVQTKEEYDYINPQHYVQDDGRQTWERMLDFWSLEQVALWCEMTAFKYKDRMGKKPNEDVERETKKIEWYENKAKELKDKTTFKFKW